MIRFIRNIISCLMICLISVSVFASTIDEYDYIVEPVYEEDYLDNTKDIFLDCVDHPLKIFIYRANTYGYMGGGEKDLFKPYNTITVGEAVTVVNKLLGIEVTQSSIKEHWGKPQIRALIKDYPKLKGQIENPNKQMSNKDVAELLYEVFKDKLVCDTEINSIDYKNINYLLETGLLDHVIEYQWDMPMSRATFATVICNARYQLEDIGYFNN